MQFELTTNLSTELLPQTIGFNYEEMKVYLEKGLAQYKDVAVTEETMAGAKKIRADINKLSGAINAQKISVKKQWLIPYQEFEDKCKDLIGMCDATCAAIDKQIKDIESAKKKEKEETLKKIFADSVGDMSEYCTWEYAFDAKWLNATVSEDKATEQMKATIKHVSDDVAIIKALKADARLEATMLDQYKQSHDLGSTVATYNRVKADIEARERRMAQVVEPPKQTAENANIAPEHTEEAAQEAIETLELRFFIPASMKKPFGEWCRANGIKYERI